METILLPWVIGASLLILFAAIWIIRLEQRFHALEQRYQRLLALADEAEKTQGGLALRKLQEHTDRLDTLEGHLRTLQAALPHTLRGHGLVRYNAFNDIGGEQSFSIALVDETGGGLVLSGLQGREDIHIYAKPLQAWRSVYTLSAEEQRALALARLMVEHRE